MRKTKVIYALMASAMLCIAVTGCGSGTNETGEDYNIDIESTTTPAPTESVNLGSATDPDDVTPTTEPTATSTPVPTETPTPEPTATSTPTPELTEAPMSDWFAENGITIYGEGAYKYAGEAQHWWQDGSYTLEVATLKVKFSMSETANNDGTVTYTGVFENSNHTFKDGAWGTAYGYEFIADRYTGEVFIPNDDKPYDFNVTLEDGTVVNMIVTCSQQWADTVDEINILTINVTAPADYNGLVFGRTCLDEEAASNFEFGTYCTVPELPKGGGEIIYFAK